VKAKHYAYLAGLIDGDGCINASVAKSGESTWYRIHLSVNSVRRNVITTLEKWFGGKGKQRNRSHYKQGYIWEWRLVAKEHTKEILKNILPYLVIKYDQAELAIQFLNLSGNCSDERENLIREIQRLNQDLDSRERLVDFDNNKWPYLGGLFDAEGTFTVRKDNRDSYIHYGIWARLGNKNKQVIDWLKFSFGIEAHDGIDAYYWPLPYEREKKEKFILNLLPYLITKKDQAKVLLEYIRLGDERNPQKREELFQKCFKLNHPESLLEVTTLCN